MTLENKLFKAAALTFENMGFLFPTIQINETQLNAGFDMGTFVDFDGDSFNCSDIFNSTPPTINDILIVGDTVAVCLLPP